ncbi:MAG TPA: hypothetical protein ENN47_10720 [Mesotoga infera]|uniref:Uncharacterized protein n=1 Tax=Mesotoga infera TaxID=1236046 RepID=A0A7C1CXJ0_9BACT|nr:hypothetical protein [Mesotoga infera]
MEHTTKTPNSVTERKRAFKIGLLYGIYLIAYGAIDIVNRWRGECPNDGSVLKYLVIFAVGSFMVLIASFFLNSIKSNNESKSSLIKGIVFGVVFFFIFIACLAITEFPGMDEAHSNSLLNSLLNKIGATGFLFGLGGIVFIIISFYTPPITEFFKEHTLASVIQVAASMATAIWALLGVAITIVWAQKGWVGDTATQVRDSGQLSNYMGALMLTLKATFSATIYTFSMVFWVFKPCFDRLLFLRKEDTRADPVANELPHGTEERAGYHLAKALEEMEKADDLQKTNAELAERICRRSERRAE